MTFPCDLDFGSARRYGVRRNGNRGINTFKVNPSDRAVGKSPVQIELLQPIVIVTLAGVPIGKLIGNFPVRNFLGTLGIHKTQRFPLHPFNAFLNFKAPVILLGGSTPVDLYIIFHFLDIEAGECDRQRSYPCSRSLPKGFFNFLLGQSDETLVGGITGIIDKNIVYLPEILFIIDRIKCTRLRLRTSHRYVNDSRHGREHQLPGSGILVGYIARNSRNSQIFGNTELEFPFVVSFDVKIENKIVGIVLLYHDTGFCDGKSRFIRHR